MRDARRAAVLEVTFRSKSVVESAFTQLVGALVPFVVLPLIYTKAGRGIPDRGWIAFASVAVKVSGA